jgi:tRNA modification GTPase
MPTIDDTIVALATPPGTGGVGVVRISGGDSERIARAMLGSLPEPRVATFGTFADARGEPIDKGFALYFPAPASFTGESVLELHGHGGPVVMALLVEAATELGARRAEPGEFTKRAFLNDKLDLTQAEAVADLIESGTAQAARAALRSLNGAFSDAVHELAAELTAIRVYVEAAIDFPEEEIDFLGDAELAERLVRCAAAFESLLSRAKVGRVMRDGYQVVIVGKPNAGKSSLMNRLSGEDTAIVTEISISTALPSSSSTRQDCVTIPTASRPRASAGPAGRSPARTRCCGSRMRPRPCRSASRSRSGTACRSRLCATKSTRAATARDWSKATRPS